MASLQDRAAFMLCDVGATLINHKNSRRGVFSNVVKADRKYKMYRLPSKCVCYRDLRRIGMPMSLSDHQVHPTDQSGKYHAAGRPVMTELEMFVRHQLQETDIGYTKLCKLLSTSSFFLQRH